MNGCSFIFMLKLIKTAELRGIRMITKKKFTEERINGVHLGKGTLTFQNITLNVYSFSIDGVIIDTGAKSLEKDFADFFKKQDADFCVITHYHEDHTGNARILQEEMKLPIYMDSQKIDYCKTKADYPLYRKLFWGKRPPFEAKPIGKTFTSRTAVWKVIETPGHSPDHLAFLNHETGQLFAGDLYVTPKPKVILDEEHIPTTIESLKKILAYPFEDVFCSHAGYVQDGRKALQRKLEYLLELQHTVLRLYNEGFSPKQITNQLFPKKFPIINVSLGEWDSKHLVYSILQGLT